MNADEHVSPSLEKVSTKMDSDASSLDERLLTFEPQEGWLLQQCGSAMVVGGTTTSSGAEGAILPESTKPLPLVRIDELEQWRRDRIADFYANLPDDPAPTPAYSAFYFGPPGASWPLSSGVSILVGQIAEHGPAPTSIWDTVLTRDGQIVRIRAWGPEAPSADAVAARLFG